MCWECDLSWDAAFCPGRMGHPVEPQLRSSVIGSGKLILGGNPDILGQTIELNEHRYTIVGVTPAVFQGSQTGVRTEVWVPLMMQALMTPDGDLLHDHHYFWLLAFGRLKPGVTLAQAQQEMTLRLRHEVTSYPEEHKGHETVTVYQLRRNPFGFNQFLSTLLPVLMCIAGLVLLLACVNVSNLMLVRGLGRRRELAIRMSLGGTRWRLIRQLLVESLVLALAGGAVALLITLWTPRNTSEVRSRHRGHPGGYISRSTARFCSRLSPFPWSPSSSSEFCLRCDVRESRLWPS
jgi:MacB-like periplasmic core domain